MTQNTTYVAWKRSGDLGRAVRKARKAWGLTQAKLAKRAGVSCGFLGQFERGAESQGAMKTFDVLEVLQLTPLVG